MAEFPGTIVVLNGAPRSGKSELAQAIQRVVPGAWMVFGVDAVMAATPPALLPGIGLRPGGERPELEPFVAQSYASLFDAVLAFNRRGLNVAVDTGMHDAHSRPLGVLTASAHQLADCRAYLIGVRCDLEVILDRRDADHGYLGRNDDGSAPDPVLRWQEAVHQPGIYDLEVETSTAAPDTLANTIARHITDTAPAAFRELLNR